MPVSIHVSRLLIFALMMLSVSVSAQVTKSTFRGTVVDESDQAIPGATVMILHPADSTLVSFGTSNAEGVFVIKNVVQGEYLLNIHFLGLEAQYIPVTAGDVAEKDMGKIKLMPATQILTPVEVMADHVPIEIKKDTITYNPDAFQTQPNAVVEDLLKKLPGIEVESDGTIKAQGEEVKNVYVDGKEFFGDDPKMATKNLPAKALKKVKVYDKQSEIAEFTGVDDGMREKTIDLQLKEEFKKGLFGTAQMGYGSDGKYNGKASINRFTKTSQASFLGQLNNINDQGFSFSDRMNFAGGMRGMWSGGGGSRSMEFRVSSGDIPFNTGLSNGLVNTGAGGINFNFQKSKNFNIRTSYFFNNVDKELSQESFRQNLLENPFDTKENTDQTSINRSHSFALNSDIQIDSSSQLQLISRLAFGDASANGISLLQNISQSILENESLTMTDDENDNLSLSAGATYMKRLGTKGRNFSLNGNLNKNDDKYQNYLDALTEYYTTGDLEVLNQFQYSQSNSMRWEAQGSYTEPLRKRRFLEANYFFSRQETDYEKRVTDITDSTSIINPGLSTDYTSTFSYHRPGLTFRYSGEIHNLTAGFTYQISELTGLINQSESEISRTYSHLLPRVIWRFDIGNGKHLRMSYTTRVNAPSITQLSPVIDNSDPLRLYQGNPQLDAEFSHNLNANFHLFSQFSSTSFFVSANGGITHDKIITARTFDSQFQEISSPINIDQESRLSFYTSFGRPFKPIHSRYSISFNATYTRTQNSINNEILDLDRWSRSLGLTISNLNSNVLEYSLGGRWTFTDSYYKTNEALNQNTLLSNYFIESTLTLWKKWRIEGSFDYNLYTSDEFAENQSLPLMKASISRFVLPNDKGQIKLSVFDVLDENRGLSRSADINYLEEIRTNSIGRYMMLSFIYSIRGHQDRSGLPGGGMRFIERRG